MLCFVLFFSISCFEQKLHLKNSMPHFSLSKNFDINVSLEIQFLRSMSRSLPFFSLSLVSRERMQHCVNFSEVDCIINLCIEYVWSGVYFDINSKYSFIPGIAVTHTKMQNVYEVWWWNAHRFDRKRERNMLSCHMKIPSPTGIEL